MLETLLTSLLVVLGWLISLAIYRLYLHPLAKIPGPKLAALTFWYECYYDVSLPGRYVFKIKELHGQYGPIIRITPREVHVNDPDFLPTIYPLSPLHKRDKDPMQLRGLDVGLSTASTVGHDLHRQRREALAPFFSEKRICELEEMIRRKVEQMCEILDNSALETKDPRQKRQSEDRTGNRVVDLYDLYYAFARDIVFQYCFGKDSDVLANMTEAAILRRNITDLLLGVKFTKHFYPIVWAMRKLPGFVDKYVAPPGAKNMRDMAISVRNEIDQVLADTTDTQKTHQKSIFYSLRDKADLPAAEKSPFRLQQEGTMLIMAGTESTARLLSLASFHLLSKPLLLDRLRAELDTLATSPPLPTLLRLPFLSAVILEASRLSFGLTGRNQRIAPSETLHYGPYAIPPGTPVAMSTLCAGTDAFLFPEPDTFDPDRWLFRDGDAKGMETVRKRRMANLGFGLGARKCLGVNLARAEVAMALAAVLRRDCGRDMRIYKTGVGDVEFQHDFQVAHARRESQGVRVRVVRR